MTRREADLRGRRRRQHIGIGAAAVTALVLLTGATALLRAAEEHESLNAAGPTPGSSAGASSSASPNGASPAHPQPSADITTAPPTLDRATHARLLVVQGDDLALLDVDSGRLAPVATDSRLRGYSRINATSVEREVLFVGDDSTGAGGGGGEVLATTRGLGSPLRVLGTSDPHILLSRRPGRIWLSSVTDAHRQSGRPRTELTEVDLRGTVTQRVVFDGTFGATPFAGGFLRDVSLERHAGVELVNAEGSRSRVWPRTRLLGVWGDRALLGDVAPCPQACSLHVITAVDGVTERRVEVQDQEVLEWQAGGLSQDGQLLFSAVPQADEPSVRIARTDLASGVVTLLHGVRSTRYYGFAPTFSADGRWMFFVDADRDHLNAYDILQHRSYRVRGDFTSTSSVVVVG